MRSRWVCELGDWQRRQNCSRGQGRALQSKTTQALLSDHTSHHRRCGRRTPPRWLRSYEHASAGIFFFNLAHVCNAVIYPASFYLPTRGSDITSLRWRCCLHGACADALLNAKMRGCPHFVWENAGLFVNSAVAYKD